uniref:Uncharacterized protein n=1 Tax=Caenorhabditis japonica TaxID=281687 RepID=A0A8R1IE74_CAEJA
MNCIEVEKEEESGYSAYRYSEDDMVREINYISEEENNDESAVSPEYCFDVLQCKRNSIFARLTDQELSQINYLNSTTQSKSMIKRYFASHRPLNETIGANFGQWQLHGPYGELVKQAGQHATTTTCHLLRKVILRWREYQKRWTWPLVVKAGDVNDVLCSPLGNLIHDPFDICCGIQKTFQSRFYFVH